MNQNGNTPRNSERLRRAERYAGELLSVPSMSAPQPIPGRQGNAAPEPRKRSQAEFDPSGVASQPEMEELQGMPVDMLTQPMQPSGEAAAEWQSAYPPQQPYAAQMGGYPAQMDAMQQGWSQPWPVQQPGEAMQQPGSAPAPQAYATPTGYPEQQYSQPYMQQAAPTAWQGSSGYVAGMVLDQAPGEIPKARYGGNGSGGGWWKLALAAAVLVTLIVLAVLGGIKLSEHSALRAEVTAYNSRFCEGVYVDGIHLGGMTQEEAIRTVSANAQMRMDAWNIRLEYEGSLVRRITAQDLGMTVNVNDALAEAWEQGHASSDIAERKAAMDALLAEPYYGYTASPSGDTRVVDSILNQMASVVYSLPKDAYVTGYDPQAHSDPFTIEPEVNGTMLDVAPIKAQINAMVDEMQSGSIQLNVQPLYPKVTEASLRKMRTLRGSATTEISTTSTEGRTANIQRAFELINGTTLKPGQSFSFNGVVGERTAKNGFFEAIEYAYGGERKGYGGGVCQASTTIYLAAVRADMTITKREPHSQKVNYTEYGLDATVNLDGKKIDLVFKNTTNSDVYILTYLARSGGRWVCHVDIYGEALEQGVTYDLVAETVKVLPAPVDPEYVEDKDGENVVYIDETPVLKRKASDGYVVDTFKVKYVDGKEVERTYVASDTYNAKSQQYWVGVSNRVTPRTTP